ncbi:CAP domain-containing protein [Streptomyces sp. CHD11]|uniref:CAP domain-containing protein n=1 Tax=Streptomyces sp. CHD11 TaxID=2741325 RepID=UPI001BFCBC8C|nr:CAP domain-containing protein [Streptomyces sp. CHD11]MBT3152915.1 CAP domain-containing protein [Streptomyces sp. CHD11]
MGRHRRSAAGRAATGRAAGATHHEHPYEVGTDSLADLADGPPTMGTAPYLNPEAYAETYARSEAYLYAPDEAAAYSADADFTRGGFPGGDFPRVQDRPGHAFAGDSAPVPDDGFATRVSYATREESTSARGFASTDGFAADEIGRPTSAHRRRKKKAATPVRTGLLGVSAAMAIGTVAVATGAIPGLENYKLGGDSAPGEEVQAGDLATSLPTEQGGTSGPAESPGRDAGSPASRDSDRSAPPARSEPSATPSTPDTRPKTPEKTEPEKEKPAVTPERTAERGAEKAPSRKATPEPEKKTNNPGPVSAEAAAGAEVLRLVNAERAKVGCSPVAANSALTDLATAFSDDMAKRGFFDHTDPDGDSPWDRAQTAGVSGLGGENIARGQADAEAVMQAWMDSPGHKANILNCDFKTLGVGVHMGPGGPWWTQNFGY